MVMRLWLATVEHVSVPGTYPTMFYQVTAPSDRAIKARFAGIAKPKELNVTAVFDLTHTLDTDVPSRKALEQYRTN